MPTLFHGSESSQHHRVSQRATQPWFSSLRQGIAADVNANKQVSSQGGDGSLQSGNGPGHPTVDINVQDFPAVQRRHLGLGKAHAVVGAGVTVDHPGAWMEDAGIFDFSQATRAGNRIVDKPLPG